MGGGRESKALYGNEWKLESPGRRKWEFQVGHCDGRTTDKIPEMFVNIPIDISSLNTLIKQITFLSPKVTPI